MYVVMSTLTLHGDYCHNIQKQDLLAVNINII